MVIHDIRSTEHLHWDPILDNLNDSNLGAVTNDDEDGEVTLVNVNQLEGAS